MGQADISDPDRGWIPAIEEEEVAKTAGRAGGKETIFDLNV